MLKRKLLIKLPLLQRLLRRLAMWRVAEKIEAILSYLKPSDTILDIGSGNGVLCFELRRHGYAITALDIENSSFIDSVTPILYDGVKVPWDDASFDVALLITVLHHTPDPAQVLTEAMRVARRIIVIEEIYSGVLDRYLTYFIDSVFNFEFFGHPHTNKTDAGWRDTIAQLGLEIVHVDYTRSIGMLQRVTYVLDRPCGGAKSFGSVRT